VRTREALRRALLKLLEIKPLDQITVRDIAAESGVGYATFFRHHTTKESLLNDVAADEIQRLVGAAMSALQTTGDTRASSVALCTYVREHRALWSALLSDGAVEALREQFLLISKRIANALAPREHWLPNDIAVILVITGTIELFAWWLKQKDPLPIAKIAEIHDRIVASPTVNSGPANPWRSPPSPRRARLPKKIRKETAQSPARKARKLKG
jgi:AcrR family transcriptional regulator